MSNSYFVEDINPGDLDEEFFEEALYYLRTDLLQQFRVGPLDGMNDLEGSLDLTKLLHEQLEKFGTDSSQVIDNEQCETAIKTLKSSLARLGINFSIPFRNFSSFLSHWQKLRLVGQGSWRARRELLESIFSPVYEKLDEIEENSLRNPIVNPVGSFDFKAWVEVDNELIQLRRKFDAATTPQDYRGLGPHCIGVLEALGRVIHNPETHLEQGETRLPDDRIKERLTRFVREKLPESSQGGEELCKQALATIALAHKLKHLTSPTAQLAGIACDSVVLLASMIRRLSDPTTTPKANQDIPF